MRAVLHWILFGVSAISMAISLAVIFIPSDRPTIEPAKFKIPEIKITPALQNPEYADLALPKSARRRTASSSDTCRYERSSEF